MTAPLPIGQRLVVDRWDVSYCVPEGASFTQTDRHGLDTLLRSEVAASLAESLASSLDRSDPSVWRIRTMDVELSTRLERSGWASTLAIAVLNQMTEDANPDRVLCFPTRAHYLAHFLVDLVHGRAWDKWYFEEFESLRILSTSRAACEALLQQEGDVAPTLLALMASQGLYDVLEFLSLIDARRLFDAWLPAASGQSSATLLLPWIERLLSAWSETPLRLAGDNPPRDGLWWLTLAASRYPEGEHSHDLPKAVSALLDLRTVFLSMPSPWHRGEVIQRLAKGQLKSAEELAVSSECPSPQTSLALLADLMQGDGDWALHAVSILVEGRDAAPTISSILIPYGPAHSSTFCGIFRLGPSFIASAVPQILAAAGVPALIPLLLQLIAAKCMGSAQAGAALGDIALRSFSGLGSEPIDALVEDAAFHELDVAAMRRAFLDELLDDARTIPSNWLTVRCSLADADAATLLLIDSETREWIDLASASLPEPYAQPWSLALACFEGLPLPPAIDADSLPGRSPSVDLAWLSLSGVLPQIPEALDHTLSLLANCVLRHFARRLMDFRRSSPEHLFQNFLVGTGYIRDAGYRIEIELAPPPLAIVLRLAGIDRETYLPDWLQTESGGREICILPSQD